MSNQPDCISPDVDPELLKAINESAASGRTSPTKKLDDAAALPSCDSAVDSWEELDSDDSKLVDEVFYFLVNLSVVRHWLILW